MNAILILLTAVGGGLGAMARYHFGKWLQRTFSQNTMPDAILIVNISGSFGLGVMMGMLFESAVATETVPLVFYFAGTGFFGAFTTFSTFSVETVQLIRKKAARHAAVYVGVSILGSFAAFITGVFLNA